jgi:hypothetical protein
VAENEFSDAFSGAYDAVDAPPVANTACTPAADWSCAYTDAEFAALDAAIVERSEALAWSTLVSLTGYQIAACPIEVRPCTEKCVSGTWIEAPHAAGSGGGYFRPGVNSQGYWVNSCGCGGQYGCSCVALSEVVLPGPVGGIVEVLLDGGVVDPADYRVDNGNRLVAQWGMTWPACQDMRLPASEPDTFSVRYYQGFAPDILTQYAAGVLAVEFYKACTGGKCRLPAGVTSITRQGVSMEIQNGLFTDGFTGIREVDAIIQIYNPNGLKMPSTVSSPDVAQTRTPTWRF